MSQCNFCGYTEPHSADLQVGVPLRPVVPCEYCGSQICSGCRPNHEVGCRPNAQKKALGVGPTVSAVPYEHRAGHVVPETTPPDPRKNTLVMIAGIVNGERSASNEMTPEPNEGPWMEYRSGTNVLDAASISASVESINEPDVTENKNENEVPSLSESVPEFQQNSGTPSIVEGSTDSNGSDSVLAADDSGHVSDASGDGSDAPSPSQPEVEMVDPATADGE